MRIFALELNNDIKGIEKRKEYIEFLISKLLSPDLIVLPELAICSYMANQEIWQYADDQGKNTSMWTIDMAQKYNTYIGIGYLDKEGGEYFNRYMIVGPNGVYGNIAKSEGESAVFKRGWFDNVISTPFGNVGVAICYDSKRKHFYENVKEKELSLILFPHGCPANPSKAKEEIKTNDLLGTTYMDAFGIPVVYVNCKGKLEYMPGRMGHMMSKAGFAMTGKTKIYAQSGINIETELEEVIAMDVDIVPKRLKKSIKFYQDDLIKGNWLFRQFILKPDTKAGIKDYNRNH
jgi:omega-amidase